jgi:glycosyltransferase involved in cell wall biosynthesis
MPDRLALFSARVNGADVVVYGMTTNAAEVAVLQAGRAAHGYKLIIDTDDLVTDVPKYNQASSMYHNATGLARIVEAQYRDCDAVTTSTEPLREATDHYNSRVYHVPNLVDPKLYSKVRFRQKEERHRDDLRIYWGGGGGHYDDLLVAKDALLKVCTKRQNVKLVFSNFVPAWALDLPSDRVFFVRLTDFPTFRKLLPWLCIDVGIAPLVENHFNECKSHVKYLDYAMAHIPGVYSDLPAYESVTANWTGLKPYCESDWYDCINELLESKELRTKIAYRAHEHVMNELTVDTFAPRYEAILEDLLTAKAAPKVEKLSEGVPIACQPQL